MRKMRHNEDIMGELKPSSKFAQEIKDSLQFPRSVLVLLKETRLFSPLLDQAIEDIDSVIKKAEELK